MQNREFRPYLMGSERQVTGIAISQAAHLVFRACLVQHAFASLARPSLPTNEVCEGGTEKVTAKPTARAVTSIINKCMVFYVGRSMNCLPSKVFVGKWIRTHPGETYAELAP
jgi:hypothetical protein